MEAFAAVFKDLYTSFLLRDFAGKVVPGMVLILCAAMVVVPPAEVLGFITRRLNLPLVAFAGGLAWILVLSLQGITGHLHIWDYYPAQYKGAPLEEGAAQLVVQDFLRLACQVDRNQYERLVVIKEATGNLFAVVGLSIPLAGIAFLFHDGAAAVGQALFGSPVRAARTMVMLVAATVLVSGMRLMNQQHIFKQYDFAATFVAKKPPACSLDKTEKADAAAEPAPEA